MSKKRFIILTTQRTGSTALTSLLNSHPQIRAHSEVFLMKSGAHDAFPHFLKSRSAPAAVRMVFLNRLTSRLAANPVGHFWIDSFLSSLVDDARHSAPWTDLQSWDVYQEPNRSEQELAVGYKIMYNHLRRFPYLRHILRRDNYAIIHLIRDDPLAVYVSRLRAKRQGLRHVTNEAVVPAVRVDVKDFRRFADRFYKEISRHRKYCHHYPESLEVHYSSLFGATDTDIQRILKFLGVRSTQRLSSFLRKISQDDISEQIDNWDELQPHLPNLDNIRATYLP